MYFTTTGLGTHVFYDNFALPGLGIHVFYDTFGNSILGGGRAIGS
jgi:hypothetical protein